MDLYRDGGKRVLDLLLASIALLFALPVIALAAAAIRLDSEGPVFHRATRVGRGGKKFTFLQLRSMQIGAEELYWFGVHNARTAAAAALAEMIAAREITEPQAMAIARGYLHDNAASLYK